MHGEWRSPCIPRVRRPLQIPAGAIAVIATTACRTNQILRPLCTTTRLTNVLDAVTGVFLVLAQASFDGDHGIAPGQLFIWRRQLLTEAIAKAAAAAAFVPVTNANECDRGLA
jgi:hypothetical protein